MNPENSNKEVASTTPSGKRGRKPFSLLWPEGEFTANQVAEISNNAISKVSVHSKINDALSRGDLILVRRVKTKLGRPQAVYTKVYATNG